MSKKDELEKVTACFKMLVSSLCLDTNATHAIVDSDLTYRDVPIGRWKLEITKMGFTHTQANLIATPTKKGKARI